MSLNQMEYKLNIYDALYYEDLIYYLKKEGGLDYEPNEEIEARIQARFREIENIIEVSFENGTKKVFTNISMFLIGYSVYAEKILSSNNIPINKKNYCNVIGMIRNYPEQVNQVIQELEEKVANLKARNHKK